ncbi:hypothetical protein BDC45DRAFT_300134 [Circinella umbellata]|nr:hypothetical protein BDC45DRAFT_300134 [Circinella umbellata]
MLWISPSPLLPNPTSKLEYLLYYSLCSSIPPSLLFSQFFSFFSATPNSLCSHQFNFFPYWVFSVSFSTPISYVYIQLFLIIPYRKEATTGL